MSKRLFLSKYVLDKRRKEKTTTINELEKYFIHINNNFIREFTTLTYKKKCLVGNGQNTSEAHIIGVLQTSKTIVRFKGA